MADQSAPSPVFPDDRRIGWLTSSVAAAAALLSWVASRLLATRPDLAEAWAAGPGPAISRPLSILTGFVPFALGEVLVAAWLLWLLVSIARTVTHVIRRRRSGRNAIAGGITRSLRQAGLIVVAFYLLWGLSYARPSLESRIGWPEWSGAEVDELQRLTAEAIDWANAGYETLHGSKDAGEPTAVPRDWKRVERAIDAGWTVTTDRLDLPAAEGKRYGPIKRPFSSPIIARFGIVGMYFPFTAEANVVRGLPAVRLVTAAAHEKAHQRGIANEAEATFLGYLAAAFADDPLSRYAAAFIAESQLGVALAAADPDAWQSLASRRDPGIVRDFADLAAYYARFRGPANNVGRAVNDSYLRANRVPGGVQSYDRSVRLLIAWARSNGGRLDPADNGQAGNAQRPGSSTGSR